MGTNIQNFSQYRRSKVAKKDETKMEIWNRVAVTDVDHTKEVSFGRKFTAIDAHSQIMEATREFGPVGAGWRYDNVYGETVLADGRIIAWCDVTMYWGHAGEWISLQTTPFVRVLHHEKASWLYRVVWRSDDEGSTQQRPVRRHGGG